jgi:uncharacterized protein
MRLRYSPSLRYALLGFCMIEIACFLQLKRRQSCFDCADNSRSVAPILAVPIQVETNQVTFPNHGLIDAAHANETGTCKALIKRGVDVNQQGEFGDTPLSWAVDNQNLELVRLLLAHGADPNVHVQGPAYHIRDAAGTTPLISAVRSNNMPIFHTLLGNKRINVNFSADDGYTPLIEAVRNSYSKQPVNIDIVRALLDRGADPNLKGAGETPLSYTSRNSDLLTQLLFDHGAKVTDDSLFAAASSGKVEIMGLLLAHGGNIDVQNIAVGTLIMHAAACVQPDMVKFLVAKGARINEVVDNEMIAPFERGTALVRVASGTRFNFGRFGDPQSLIRQTAMLKLLLDEGADPNISSSERHTALMGAASRDNAEAVRLLLARAADVNAVDAQGNSAVMWAVAQGTPEVVQLLLNHGASLEIKNQNNETALIRAVCYTNLDVVQYLLSRGADVNARDGKGNTALIARTFYGENGFRDIPLTIFKLLLAHGADPNASNNLGQTALMEALKMRGANMAKLLIAHGAQVNARDKEGNSVLTYANESGQAALIQLLKRAGAK